MNVFPLLCVTLTNFRRNRDKFQRYYSCLTAVIPDALPPPHRLPRVQSQVDEVIDVMQENISKVIERGERLEDLQDKSGESDATCVLCVATRSMRRAEPESRGNFLSSGFCLNVGLLTRGFQMAATWRALVSLAGKQAAMLTDFFSMLCLHGRNEQGCIMVSCS